MFPIQKKSSEQKISAIFDIENGSVGAAVVCSHPDNPIEIFASMRSALSFDNQDARAIGSGLSLLTTVVEKTLAYYALQKKHLEPIDSVYAIIRAPWARSRTLHVKKYFDADTTVTEELITTLAQEALAADSEHQDEFFEGIIMRVEINGYPTAKPVGKTGRQVAVWVLVSECEAEISRGINEVFSRLFPGKTTIFRSGVRTIVSVLQELHPESLDYVVIDMGTAGTNILSVTNGIAVTHEYVTEGIAATLAHISTNHLPSETLSILGMVGRNQSTNEAITDINLAMSLAEPAMVKNFGVPLGALSTKHRLANKLFLFTQPELSNWLTRFFGKLDFVQFTQTTQSFAVTPFAADTFAKHISGDGEYLTDIGLLTACALVHIEQ